MHKIPAVEPRKRLQNRVEHFHGFPGGERTHPKNLCENLIGIFSDDIEQIFPVNRTASGVKNTHQAGMRQEPGRRPLSDAGFCVHRIRPTQLDGGFLCRIAFEFC